MKTKMSQIMIIMVFDIHKPHLFAMKIKEPAGPIVQLVLRIITFKYKTAIHLTQKLES